MLRELKSKQRSFRFSVRTSCLTFNALRKSFSICEFLPDVSSVNSVHPLLNILEGEVAAGNWLYCTVLYCIVLWSAKISVFWSSSWTFLDLTWSGFHGLYFWPSVHLWTFRSLYGLTGICALFLWAGTLFYFVLLGHVCLFVVVFCVVKKEKYNK